MYIFFIGYLDSAHLSQHTETANHIIITELIQCLLVMPPLVSYYSSIWSFFLTRYKPTADIPAADGVSKRVTWSQDGQAPVAPHVVLLPSI